MKETNLPSISTTLSFRWNCCHDRIEDLLSEFNKYSENRAVILSFRNNNCRCKVSVLEGTVAERVEDILSGNETDNALRKAHRASTWLSRLSCSWASVQVWYNLMWKFGLWIYLTNTRTNMCFAVNTVYDWVETCSPCYEVPKGFSRLWTPL